MVHFGTQSGRECATCESEGLSANTVRNEIPVQTRMAIRRGGRWGHILSHEAYFRPLRAGKWTKLRVVRKPAPHGPPAGTPAPASTPSHPRLAARPTLARQRPPLHPPARPPARPRAPQLARTPYHSWRLKRSHTTKITAKAANSATQAMQYAMHAPIIPWDATSGVALTRAITIAIT